VASAGVALSVALALLPPAPTVASANHERAAVTDMAPLPSESRLALVGQQQLLTYWSRGPRGPMQSTAAVYTPSGAPPPEGWPVVAYTHGTVGIADHCAFTLRPRDYYTEALYPSLLDAGYAVVVSDYVGLGTPGVHPYLDGPAQARSVVDGVRAAHAAVPGLADRWAVFGQSQGGQAALLTARIAPDDAPELEFRGGAATGPPSNLENGIEFVGPWIPALPLRRTTTYFAFLLAGLRANAPELDIDSYLTPVGHAALRTAQSQCLPAAEATLGDVSLGDMVLRPLDDPALTEVVDAMLRIPTAGYSTPLFIGQGIADRDVPAPLTTKLAAEMRLSGTDVTSRVYPGDHIEAATASLPDVHAFLDRVLGLG